MPPASTSILFAFDPGVQEYDDAAVAVDYARRANDDLADTVRQHPDCSWASPLWQVLNQASES